VLPPRLVSNGALSEAQLETLIYAASAFERDLPGRFRAINQGCDIEAADETARPIGADISSATGPAPERAVRSLQSFSTNGFAAIASTSG
jgi:hypothetical protein